MQDSNLRLLRCKRSALPAELIAQRRRWLDPAASYPTDRLPPTLGYLEPRSGVPRITAPAADTQPRFRIRGHVHHAARTHVTQRRNVLVLQHGGGERLVDAPVGLGDTVRLLDLALGFLCRLVDAEAALLNRLLGGRLFSMAWVITAGNCSAASLFSMAWVITAGNVTSRNSTSWMVTPRALSDSSSCWWMRVPISSRRRRPWCTGPRP